MKSKFNFTKFIAAGSVFILVFFSSCIKNWRNGETQFNGLQPVVLIPEGGANGTAFGLAALNSFSSADSVDTANFHVNYAATNVAPGNETVGLAIDTAAVSAYNSANGTTYLVMPDSLFSFTTTQATVNAGNNYSGPIPFIVHPNKIDPSKSYMLPITITTAPSGSIISGNQNTIYYHIIGNPIAGAYNNCEWIRWNAADSSGAPAYDVTGLSTVISPVSPTEVLAQSPGNGAVYDITFTTNSSGVPANFTVTLLPSSYTNFGLATLVNGPIIEDADPVNGIFRFAYQYVNTGGNPRIAVDVFRR